MSTLLIDNYDSFSFNLYQLLGEVNGEEPSVIRNDELTWPQVRLRQFDAIVISPGPGRPDRERDFGICRDVLRYAETPVLGVCLGHQGLGAVSGGTVIHAPAPVHGRLSRVEHGGSGLFAGLPQAFRAVRYHSLCLARPLPPELRETARSEDGVIMAIEHRHRPAWGVQFHPESIETEHGRRLMENFRDLARSRNRGGRRVPGVAAEPSNRATPKRGQRPAQRGSGQEVRLLVERIDCSPDTREIFSHFRERHQAAWLDSSRPVGGQGRFSFITASGGPRAALATYVAASGKTILSSRAGTSVHHGSILGYLERELDRLRLEETSLPFDFNCGFVGYLGYELRRDAGSHCTHASPAPDAAFLLADRLIAVDHLERSVYILALAARKDEREASQWLAHARSVIAGLPEDASRAPLVPSLREQPSFIAARTDDQYLTDIARCLEHIRDGESYELCLTNRFTASMSVDPLLVHEALRHRNPAPFAAFLDFGSVGLACSSPERFLRVEPDGWVETRPIKGTAARQHDRVRDLHVARALREDEKTRAENLMIVDVLRNDLGRVCRVGSVSVPAMFEVETYATVHQLVSTVRGRLRDGLGALDALRACFPGGSMTGAPKLRAIELLDGLEPFSRGVYSGAAGYFGLGRGADLNVVIRSAVVTPDTVSIGAGGAIVAQSNPDQELAEMWLKARPPMDAVADAMSGAAEQVRRGPLAKSPRGRHRPRPVTGRAIR